MVSKKDKIKYRKNKKRLKLNLAYEEEYNEKVDKWGSSLYIFCYA